MYAYKDVARINLYSFTQTEKLFISAQHVVEQQNDIAQAMKFLEQCDLIKIEDILPFFPDFTTIDHFKDAICSSLQVIPSVLFIYFKACKL